MHGTLAQMVEQWTENPCVPGSIPGGTTKPTKKLVGFLFKIFYNIIEICKNKKKRPISESLLQIFAVWTGLEPATSAVTGRHSNQLNYQTISLSRTAFPSNAMQRYLL